MSHSHARNLLLQRDFHTIQLRQAIFEYAAKGLRGGQPRPVGAVEELLRISQDGLEAAELALQSFDVGFRRPHGLAVLDAECRNTLEELHDGDDVGYPVHGRARVTAGILDRERVEMSNGKR